MVIGDTAMLWMADEPGVHIRQVGLLAAVPVATLQRVLGGKAGHLAADRTCGIGPRPVAARALPAPATVGCTFHRHTLDGAAVRSALLGLAVQLDIRLRRRGQPARALNLTLT